MRFLLALVVVFVSSLALAKGQEVSKTGEMDREPASANCFAKGDQDGYLAAQSDYKALTGKTSGCTRLLAAPIEAKCNKSGDYLAGFRAGYTQTMRDNVSAHKTNLCPKAD